MKGKSISVIKPSNVISLSRSAAGYHVAAGDNGEEEDYLYCLGKGPFPLLRRPNSCCQSLLEARGLLQGELRRVKIDLNLRQSLLRLSSGK